MDKEEAQKPRFLLESGGGNMGSSRLSVLTLLALLIPFILFNSSLAQYVVRLNDQQWIELALDMIRKGIQQQDTTKVFMVFAPQVSVKGKNSEVRGNLTTKLQAVFDNSSKRKLLLKKPSFPREDNPLHFSDLWDFDILDPEIKIEGDSAIVDCELVLWGTPPLKGSKQAGRRTKERFIFKSPPKIKHTPFSGDSNKWPTRTWGENERRTIRTWQLVGFESLLDFLTNYGDMNTVPKEKE